MSVRNTRYVFDRLLMDALRAEDVPALNMVTRAAGIMGKSVAERGEQPAVLTTGEPVDRFVAPRPYVEPGPCPQAFIAALSGAECWADPVLFPADAPGNRHTWRPSFRSTVAQRERGYYRLECSACGVVGEMDSSG